MPAVASWRASNSFNLTIDQRRRAAARQGLQTIENGAQKFLKNRHRAGRGSTPGGTLFGRRGEFGSVGRDEDGQEAGGFGGAGVFADEVFAAGGFEEAFSGGVDAGGPVAEFSERMRPEST